MHGGKELRFLLVQSNVHRFLKFATTKRVRRSVLPFVSVLMRDCAHYAAPTGRGYENVKQTPVNIKVFIPLTETRYFFCRFYGHGLMDQGMSSV